LHDRTAKRSLYACYLLRVRCVVLVDAQHLGQCAAQIRMAAAQLPEGLLQERLVRCLTNSAE